MRLGSNSPSNIYNIIHNLRQINKFTNFNTRQKFINGLVIGKLNYMLPLYTNASIYTKTPQDSNDCCKVCDR